MEIKPKRHVTTRSKEEKQRLFEQWEVSGKTKSEFCNEIGIPLGTFTHWVKKKYDEPKKSRTNILPLKIISKSQHSSDSTDEKMGIEIFLGTHTKICINLPIKNLISFIQELSYATSAIR